MKLRKTILPLLAILLAVPAGAGTKKKADPFVLTPRVTNVTPTSFDVIFQTEEDALCWVEIAPDDGSNWYQEERSRFYSDVRGRHLTGKRHYVTVDGLQPGTPYRYRVVGRRVEEAENYWTKYGRTFNWQTKWGDNAKYAPVCTVRTLDPDAAECRFSVVNDIHWDDARLSALVGAMPAGNDFLFMNGDMVSDCRQVDTVLRHMFLPIASTVCNTPVFFGRGNHENRGVEWYLMPREFPTPTGESYYIFRQGPAAFLVLDAGEDKPDTDIEYYGTAGFDRFRARELEWIRSAVKDPVFASAPQKICMIHIPALRDDAWHSQQWVCDNITPILNDAGVDLMLSGHLHRRVVSCKGENGNIFPIFVNSNTERLDVVATATGITVTAHDADGNVTETLQTGSTLRIASFNNQADLSKDGHNWAERAPRVKKLMDERGWDVVGMQEPFWFQVKQMEQMFPQYGWVGNSTDGKIEDGYWHYNPIFYRKDRLEVLDWGSFWFSETPQTPGSKSWDAHTPRFCVWARFRDLRTSREFYEFNCHFDHKGETARQKSAALVLSRAREISGGKPFFINGDFNTVQDSPAYKVLSDAGLTDTYCSAPVRENTLIASWNDWKPGKAVEVPENFDHIFISDGTKALSWRLLTTRYDGNYPSDHFPIEVEWQY